MSKYKLIFVVALQTAVIMAIIVYKMLILGTGREIQLRILPVDPRDPLRGDYMTFSYDISTANSFDYTLKEGEQVYVPLKKYGEYWAVNGYISRQKIYTDFNTQLIKGRVVRVYVPKMDNYYKYSGDKYMPQITIRYGIEDYFIPEGKGNDILQRECNINSGSCNLKAVVRVDDEGRAVLKDVVKTEGN